jgi:alanyl aminopeptidase
MPNVCFTPGVARVPVVLALLLALAGPAAAEIRRLPTDARPTFQEVFLRLDPATERFTGSVRMDLVVDRPTAELRFHAPTATIGRILLFDAEGPVPARVSEPDDQEQVTLTAERPLVPGKAWLGLDFENGYAAGAIGLYRTESGGDWYAFTQMEPDDARLAFPSWDEPAYKIPWKLTIEVPEGQTALSNMPETARSTRDGWTRFEFATSPPMPSYLVAMAVGPFDFVPVAETSTPTRIVTPRGKAALAGVAAELTPPILAAMEDWFERPYPYPKLDLIALSEFWPGAMENPGLITFHESRILFDTATAGPGERRGFARLAAHEIAHIWFGDYVTMDWWDDLWLNEAFADWLGDKITDRLWPEYRHLLTQQSSVDGQMRNDARPGSLPIRHPVASTHELLGNVGLVYAKGKRVLGMIERWIGPEPFRRGVLEYLEANAWGNARGEDLWAALSAASGQDVGAALRGFLELPGYPSVRVEPLAGGRIGLSQERFTTAGRPAGDDLWTVPVTLRWSDGATVRESTLLLDAVRKEFDLGAAAIAWIHPNADGLGYYRWTLPAELDRSLRAVPATALTPGDRIDLAGNATSQIEGGALGAEAWFATQARLAADPDPTVLFAAVQNVETLAPMLVPAERGDGYAAWLRRAFGPALERIGMEPRANEETALTLARPRLFRLLGVDGASPEVRRAAERLVAAHRAGASDLDPSLVEAAHEVRASHGDLAFHAECRARLEAARTPPERDLALKTLAAFRTPEAARATLALALTPAIRTTEFRNLWTGFGRWEGGQDLLFAWIRDDFAAVWEKLSPNARPFLPRTLSGCSVERQAALEAFFRETDRQAPGIDGELARGRELHRDCQALREREGAAVARALAAP